MKKSYWSILILLILAFSCLEEPDCVNLNNTFIGVSFKKLSDKSSVDFSIDSIRADGVNEDFQVGSSNIANLPLNFLSDSTTFRFFASKDTVYTMRLHYSAKAQFVSEACGGQFVLSDLNIVSHTFTDSVRLINNVPRIGNSSIVNIEIYKRDK